MSRVRSFWISFARSTGWSLRLIPAALHRLTRKAQELLPALGRREEVAPRQKLRVVCLTVRCDASALKRALSQAGLRTRAMYQRAEALSGGARVATEASLPVGNSVLAAEKVGTNLPPEEFNQV